MTDQEKTELITQLTLSYPQVDPAVINQIVNLNQYLPLEKAKITCETLVIQRLIMELDEKVKLGEIETQNVEKISALKEKLNHLFKLKRKIGVFYLE